MIFNLSSGEAIHLGAAVSLTFLGVEGDLVYFGLETLQGQSHDEDKIDEGCDEADLKQRRNGWILS
jgi:hypothetical protein